MHALSDYDEALVCPNPHSPRSWTMCKTLDECRSPTTIAYAAAARKPLTLVCLDQSPDFASGAACEAGARYYLANLTEWDSGGLFVGCFHRDTISAPSTSTWPGFTCTPPMILDDFASLFTPTSDFPHANDPTVCGFNLIPYETLNVVQSRYGITEHVAATDYTITWSQASYASQAATVAEQAGPSASMKWNYSLLEKSTLPMPKVGKQAGAMWQY